MLSHSHAILTPGASRKRKERDALDAPKASTPTSTSAQAEPLSNNRLLAGYLAHEFLTKGTLLGQAWDAARADSTSAPRHDYSVNNPTLTDPGNISTQPEPIAKSRAYTYGEVANLLKADGAHIPGIVNPTQLGRWIQM